MTTELKEAIEVLKKNRERDTMLKRKYHPNAGEKYYNERSDTEEAIDTVVANYEKNKTEFLKGVSTQEYGEDGIGLTGDELMKCLSKEDEQLYDGVDKDHVTYQPFLYDMKDLVNKRNTMTSEWFNAHMASIILRTFNAGLDFAINTLEKKGDEDKQI